MELSRISTAPYWPRVRRISQRELQLLQSRNSINPRIGTAHKWPIAQRPQRLSQKELQSRQSNNSIGLQTPPVSLFVEMNSLILFHLCISLFRRIVGQSRDEAWRGKKSMLHGRRLINYQIKPGKKTTNGECLENRIVFSSNSNENMATDRSHILKNTRLS